MKTKVSETLEQIKEYLQIQNIYFDIDFAFGSWSEQVISYSLEIEHENEIHLHEIQLIDDGQTYLEIMTAEDLLDVRNCKYVQYSYWVYYEDLPPFGPTKETQVVSIHSIIQ